MNVMMVRAKIKEENVAEAQAATGMVLQALEQAQLNVRYAASTLSNGVTLVAFLQLEPRSGASAAASPPYVELIEHLKGWYTEPPKRRAHHGHRLVPAVLSLGGHQIAGRPAPRPAMVLARVGAGHGASN